MSYPAYERAAKHFRDFVIPPEQVEAAAAAHRRIASRVVLPYLDSYRDRYACEPSAMNEVFNG